MAERGGSDWASDKDFWSNRFHWCALAAGFLAASEGRLDDSSYVCGLAYDMFNSGAFSDRENPTRPGKGSTRGAAP
jgi:hypothetical protein